MRHCAPTSRLVSGSVAMPSSFEGARRSAFVALRGTLRRLVASLFQCIEYDDEVRVRLAHVLSQALSLFRGQCWDGSVNTVQRRGNVVDISQQTNEFTGGLHEGPCSPGSRGSCAVSSSSGLW